MIKKVIFVMLGLGLTTVVLFGRNAASYVSTTYHRLTDTVQESVPIDFQIDRAKQMVSDLDPEIRRLDLTSDEKRALVAFLRTLTGKLQTGR